MKNMMLSLCLMLFAFACKKEVRTVLPAATKENIAGSYKFTSITGKSGTSAEVNIIDTYLTACQKDDLQQFKVDLTYNYIDAGVKCTPAGDDNGAWSLPAAGKMMINGVNFDIVSFTGPVLVISTTQTISGASVLVTFTLTKQ